MSSGFIIEGVGQKVPQQRAFTPAKTDNFETVLKESEQEVQESKKANEESLEKIPLDIQALKSQFLDNDSMFTQLKQRLILFNREVDKMTFDKTYVIQDYNFKKALHHALKRLLREVVFTSERVLQRSYLSRVYQWFFHKLNMHTSGAKQPVLFDEKEKEEVNRQPKKENPILRMNERKLFDDNSRSIHTHIPPAKDRMKEFEHKALPLKSNSKINANYSGILNTSNQSLETDTTRRSSSLVKNANKSLYTVNKTVNFEDSEAIEGRSNYLQYRPTNEIKEQKMEQFWFNARNKEVAEKRADEELKQTLFEWSQARSRIEEEISRKQERSNYGSDFQQRGFVSKSPLNTTANAIAQNKEVDYEKIFYSESSEEFSEDEEDSIGPEHRFAKSDGMSRFRSHPVPKVVDLTSESSMLSAPLAAAGRSMTGFRTNLSSNMNSVSVEAGKKKIDRLRKLHGNLIGATKSGMEDVNSIFMSAAPEDVITLSIYNRGVDTRPKSSYMAPRHTMGAGVRAINDDYRMDQYTEINKIKERLAKDDIPCSVVTLQRAILLPEDLPVDSTNKNFPAPGIGLMVNPFAKPKKKKKGKKKKGKKSKK